MTQHDDITPSLLSAGAQPQERQDTLAGLPATRRLSGTERPCRRGRRTHAVGSIIGLIGPGSSPGIHPVMGWPQARRSIGDIDGPV